MLLGQEGFTHFKVPLKKKVVLTVAAENGVGMQEVPGILHHFAGREDDARRVGRRGDGFPRGILTHHLLCALLPPLGVHLLLFRLFLRRLAVVDAQAHRILAQVQAIQELQQRTNKDRFRELKVNNKLLEHTSETMEISGEVTQSWPLFSIRHHTRLAKCLRLNTGRYLTE